jgi:23S rRNA pseudouridine1911/1915/1917 synthase
MDSVCVSKAEGGKRIDLFLKDRLPKGSRKQAKRLLDAGRVRINGRKVIIASWELKAGDQVIVAQDATLDLDVAKQFLKVVYEDESIIVVDKAAGVSCEESVLSLKPSLVQVLNDYLKRKGGPNYRPYLGLLHRLDNDTSGLMVYSKSKGANRLSAQFKAHSILRIYQGIVVGRVEQEQGHIKIPLAKDPDAKGMKVRLAVKGQGQSAVTRFRVLERYSQASLLEIIPKTGRTHQIRAHLALKGHPLIGDAVYGDPSQALGRLIKRQALHATTLGFEHPMSHQKLQFESPLPRDMQRLIRSLINKVH